MKILFISNFFPPTDNLGTEVRTFAYASALLERGHSVQVLCASEWGQGHRYWNGHTDEVYKDISIRRLRINWSLAEDPNRFLYDNPVVEKFLSGWLHEIQPDVIHITSCYTLSASIIRAANEHKIPVAFTLTDFWSICPKLTLIHGNGSLCNGQTTPWECLRCNLWENKSYRWPKKMLPDSILKHPLMWLSQKPQLAKYRGFRGMALDMTQRKQFLAKMFAQVDQIIASTQTLHATVTQSGMPLSMRIVYRGQNLEWLEQYKGKTKTDTLRIGYIGTLSHHKGVHVILEAFQLARFGAEASLSIYGRIGADSYTEKLVADAAAQDNIVIKGEFARDEVAEIFTQIDVLVIPSLWYENSPHVIWEAFATKTPVVASDLGTMQEFIEHDTSGLLFERGNAKDLAKQLSRLIEEPDLIEQLRSGIPRVKDIAEEIDELATIYQELIAIRESPTFA